MYINWCQGDQRVTLATQTMFIYLCTRTVRILIPNPVRQVPEQC